MRGQRAVGGRSTARRVGGLPLRRPHTTSIDYTVLNSSSSSEADAFNGLTTPRFSRQRSKIGLRRSALLAGTVGLPWNRRDVTRRVYNGHSNTLDTVSATDELIAHLYDKNQSQLNDE